MSSRGFRRVHGSSWCRTRRTSIREDRATLQPEVRDWEPTPRSSGGTHRRRCGGRRRPSCADGGALVLEVGDGQAQATAALLTSLGYADVRHDTRPAGSRPRRRGATVSVVEDAVAALRAGGLAVIPTDTVYALAADGQRARGARALRREGATRDPADSSPLRHGRRDRRPPAGAACAREDGGSRAPPGAVDTRRPEPRAALRVAERGAPRRARSPRTSRLRGRRRGARSPRRARRHQREPSRWPGSAEDRGRSPGDHGGGRRARRRRGAARHPVDGDRPHRDGARRPPRGRCSARRTCSRALPTSNVITTRG